MRAPLLALLLLTAGVPIAAAACGTDSACEQVVFVVTNDPTTPGSRFVAFFAVGGAPGIGELVAKGVQGATLPVRCMFNSAVCQTPRAAQTSLAPGRCLDVEVALLITDGTEIAVTVNDTVHVEVSHSTVETWTYCN